MRGPFTLELVDNRPRSEMLSSAARADGLAAGSLERWREDDVLNYYDIELSPEERLTQQTIREFVDREALPLLPAAFEEGRFPTELIPRLGELGVLGADIPEYGSGASYTTYGLIFQ